MVVAWSACHSRRPTETERERERERETALRTAIAPSRRCAKLVTFSGPATDDVRQWRQRLIPGSI